ncbi:hypothetical protein MRB53_013503 [Persea americana]|uniref:Uncharacterized protein n=1 Tax=Persea americana TaxID=3435 RepID=A0ACC2K8L2_PERAE|nr:hypothetical protein MRB53_013503 [Persea americana]
MERSSIREVWRIFEEEEAKCCRFKSQLLVRFFNGFLKKQLPLASRLKKQRIFKSLERYFLRLLIPISQFGDFHSSEHPSAIDARISGNLNPIPTRSLMGKLDFRGNCDFQRSSEIAKLAGVMTLRWLDNGAAGCEVKADGDGAGGAANKPSNPRCRQGSAMDDDDDEDGDVRKCPEGGRGFSDGGTGLDGVSRMVKIR